MLNGWRRLNGAHRIDQTCFQSRMLVQVEPLGLPAIRLILVDRSEIGFLSHCLPSPFSVTEANGPQVEFFPWATKNKSLSSPRPDAPRGHETIFLGRRSCPETKGHYPPRRSTTGFDHVSPTPQRDLPPIPQCRPSRHGEPGSKVMAEVVTALCVFFSISIFLAHAVDAFRARRLGN